MTAESLDALTLRRATRLSVLLAAADPPVRAIAYPSRRVARARHTRLKRRWSIAALLALAVGGAAAAPPVRAWVTARASDVWNALGGHRARVPDAPRALPPSSVSFVPAGGAFAIRIAAWQRGGRVTIRVVPGRAVTARAEGARPGEWVVAEGELTLRNSPDATGDVAVDVPAALSHVTLQIGAEPAQQVVAGLDRSLAPAARR